MDFPTALNGPYGFLIFTLIGIGVGVVFGLVPLIYGRKKGKARLGMIGFVTSIVVGGAISGILSLLVMITFFFLILRNPLPAPPDAPASDDPDIS